MNDPWQVLDLEPTTDLATVKKVYAKKIKDFRPDEKPKEFSEIFSAYKQICKIIKSGAVKEHQSSSAKHSNTHQEIEVSQASPFDSGLDELFNNNILTTTSDPDKHTDLVTEDLSAEEEMALDNIKEMTLELINDTNNYHKPENWDFITACPHLLNDQFRHTLGKELIHIITDFNLHQNRAENEKITSNIISLLNQRFLWNTSRDNWFNPASLEDVQYIYSQIDQTINQSISPPVGGKLVRDLSIKKHRPKPASSEPSWYQQVHWRIVVFGVIYIIYKIATK